MSVPRLISSSWPGRQPLPTRTSVPSGAGSSDTPVAAASPTLASNAAASKPTRSRCLRKSGPSINLPEQAEIPSALARSDRRDGRENRGCEGADRAYTGAHMRVVVVGAGGIGGLYGGLLARAGHSVGFLARGPHLEAIRNRGLEVKSADFGNFVVRAPASEDPAELGQADLVLFAVKTYDLDAAARAAKQVLAPDASLLTFQNGLDAPDQIARMVGEQHVLIGTTGLETTILEPGVIGHLTPGHYVTVSELAGPPTPRVEGTLEMLRGAGINASIAPDGHRALWEKAWLLIPMATITTVCRAPIGRIRDLPETAALIETLVDEVTAVARAYGYDLPEARDRARTWIFKRAPATMKASMARDFERGTRTELEALTGALVRMADARGVDIPACRAAYAILKLREQPEDENVDDRTPILVGNAAGTR
jgi:2-dehydropantoate 2-reductase